MHDSFRALLVSKDEQGKQQAKFVTLEDSDLMAGEVTIAVRHSSLNYKDGLALTGKAPVLRQFPLIPGIDLAGEVIGSDDPRWKIGDLVMLNGWGVGEQHHGGFAERARVKGDWLMAIPAGWSTADTMAIGVAGFTAMMCVLALAEQGVTPESGEILVTGASGGVGSMAILLLAARGYKIVAATGRVEETDYLTALGASQIIGREAFQGPLKALSKERWAGAIDSVGSTTLAHVLSQMRENGVVAACGLAQGMDLPTTVAPFILRGVSLMGINSVYVAQERRKEIWQQLVRDIDLKKLAGLTRHINWQDLPHWAEAIVNGKVRGRTVIDIRASDDQVGTT